LPGRGLFRAGLLAAEMHKPGQKRSRPGSGRAYKCIRLLDYSLVKITNRLDVNRELIMKKLGLLVVFLASSVSHAQLFNRTTNITIVTSSSSSLKAVRLSDGKSAITSDPVTTEKEIADLVFKANIYSKLGLLDRVPTVTPHDFLKNPGAAIQGAIDKANDRSESKLAKEIIDLAQERLRNCESTQLKNANKGHDSQSKDKAGR
jgi:hypothetical protein